jgi:hypothetical protein
MEMASIIYIPSENDHERRFLALLEMTIPNKKFEICHSIGEMSARLGMPFSNVKVAVLFALSRAEIMRVMSLGNLMDDVKSILILEDDDRDMIMKAHTLRPRYITWLDSDFSNVVSVLKNMVDLYDVPQSEKENYRNIGLTKVRIDSPAMGKEKYRNL